jgi:predicted PurR-regulated permease PerM
MRSDAIDWTVRGAGLAIGIGLVLLVAFILGAARDVLLLVFLAVLLGAALEPVVGIIRGKTGSGRGLAILTVYLAFLAAVVGIAVFVVPAAVVQLGAAFERLPEFLDRIRGWTGGLRPQPLGDGVAALLDALERPLQSTTPPDPSTILGASVTLGQAGVAVVTLLALVFFWLTERPRLQRYALAFAPPQRRGGLRDAWNEIETRMGLWARGQLILMVTVGVATSVAYSLIGLPGALLLGLIAALMEVIPMVGPLLGAIPAVLVATTVSPGTALLTIGVYLLIQLIEGNILVPMVMRNSVGLSPFLVLLSLLIGGSAGGILGAIVAVPIVAAITVVLDRLQDREVPVPVDPAGAETPDEDATTAPEGTPPEAPPPKRRRRPSTTKVSRA